MKYLLPFLFILSGCTHRISKFYPEIVPAKSEVTVTLNAGAKNEMHLVYLGCGNMVLEKGGEAILTDPFFSNQALLKLLGKIRTKPEAYRLWKNAYESFMARSVVKAGLVSHTHYDHVMDLPTLIEDRYFLELEKVYGNEYLPKMLQHFDDQGVVIESFTKDQVFDPVSSSDRNYQWISVSPRIRFLPIRSNHAPHTKKKLYMDKPLDEEHFDKHLVWSNSRVGSFKWTTGTTYSFLVDFIDADTLRVFIQTSASKPPYGFPPVEELNKKDVDLAIICYASAPNVENYPVDLVNRIQPHKVMLVHWEDFFRKARYFGKQKLVRGTQPKKVRRRIDQLGKPDDFFLMPRPGTRISVKY
jgi:hypothetical protein